MKRLPPIERFWSKVDKSGPVPAHCPELGPCWVWNCVRIRGYGQFNTAGGVRHRAHVYSYELVNGPVPDGLWVLHKCDNPSCVNPGHHFLGTHLDNMRDRKAKGRYSFPPGSRKIRRGPEAAAYRPGECRNGHSVKHRYVGASGERRCSACQTAKAKRYRDKARSEGRPYRNVFEQHGAVRVVIRRAP